jgi:hypothetical protein
MKAINITGKHNIDKINEIGNESYQAVRKHMLKFDETQYDHLKQLALVREIFANGVANEIGANEVANEIGANEIGANAQDIKIKSLLKSELNHKIQGYKGQDLKKEIHDGETLINLQDVLIKLVDSNMTCYYCSKPIVVLYKNVREPLQWTLDRLDNALSHTKENTCIACLKCNLQRRVMNVEKFTFTKKLKINKL